MTSHPQAFATANDALAAIRQNAGELDRLFAQSPPPWKDIRARCTAITNSIHEIERRTIAGETTERNPNQ